LGLLAHGTGVLAGGAGSHAGEFTRLKAFTVPMPVAKSQPVPAG
jgi:hypothetical protein